jgi:hypothetical protein
VQCAHKPRPHICAPTYILCVRTRSSASGGALSPLLSLIRAKELAQARISEAAAKAKAKEEDVQNLRQAENEANPASAAPDLTMDTSTNSTGIDPERITLADLANSSRATRRKKGEASAGPRPNLRNTPARQARASAAVPK